jgi:hypothetical protein
MNWRLAFLVALVAAPGSVAIAWLAVPLLVNPSSLSVPIETLQVATAVQSLVLVAIASAVGAQLSTKVGLRAPALLALVSRGNVLAALRPQLLPGVVGGLLGAAVIVGFQIYAPSALAALQGRGSIPLVARVLYGGITEEVLIRWGLMTLLVWAGWRVLQRTAEKPSAGIVCLAIGFSALLFGVLHVPSVAAAMGTVPAYIVGYIVVGNSLFGVVAGYLYWRHGLEAAIMAHVLAHVIAYVIRG